MIVRGVAMINKEKFLSQEYIDKIIETGLWCDHGSYVHRLIEDELLESLPEHLQKMDPDDSLRHPDFRPILCNWLSARFNKCQKDIMEELKSNRDKDHLYSITRTIMCKEELIHKIKTEDFDIGRFWTVMKYYEFVDKEQDDKDLFEVTVEAKVALSDIDLMETMRSRMDYSNGDEEAEIYVKNGAQPIFMSYTVVTPDGDYLGEFDCDKTKERYLSFTKKARPPELDISY